MQIELIIEQQASTANRLRACVFFSQAREEEQEALVFMLPLSPTHISGCKLHLQSSVLQTGSLTYSLLWLSNKVRDRRWKVITFNKSGCAQTALD